MKKGKKTAKTFSIKKERARRSTLLFHDGFFNRSSLFCVVVQLEEKVATTCLSEGLPCRLREEEEDFIGGERTFGCRSVWLGSAGSAHSLHGHEKERRV